MKAKIEIDLKPFSVPNFALRTVKCGPDDSSFPLSDLDPETLERMCEEFKTAVFEKAGKNPPPQAACGCNRG